MHLIIFDTTESHMEYTIFLNEQKCNFDKNRQTDKYFSDHGSC